MISTADKNTCEECRLEFPTGRGLKIHNSRVHGEGGTGKTVDITAEKEKFDKLLMRAKPSSLLNIPLRGMARTYHDPTICLSPDEQRDLDGVIQDILAEVGGDAKSLEKLVPILPWVALIFIGGPIILDKLDKIMAARAGNTPPSEKPAPKPADGSAPSLMRKDVMPDA